MGERERTCDYGDAGEWLDNVDEAARRFRQKLRSAMRQKIEILNQKARHLDTFDNEHVHWIKLRLLDNALAIAECEADLLEIDAQPSRPPERGTAYIRLMREAAVHPRLVNAELTTLMEVLSRKPGLSEIGRDYFDDAVQKTEDFALRTRGRWFE